MIAWFAWVFLLGNRPVRLLLDECVQDRAEVRRIVAIELGALAPESVDDADVTRVIVHCANERHWLSVEQPVAGRRLEKTIDLQSEPAKSRPRVLALAIEELVSASRTQVEPQKSALPPRGEPPAAVVMPAQANRPHALTILAVGGGRMSSTEPSVFWGGGVELDGEWSTRWAWNADLIADAGTRSMSVGSADATTVSVAGALLVQGRAGRLGWGTGVGIRAGIARLSGEPASAQATRAAAVAGGWIGPRGLALVAASLPRHLVVELAVEVGYVLAPVAGDVNAARAVAIDEGWGALRVGVGARF
jgi:hypothetical protein